MNHLSVLTLLLFVFPAFADEDLLGNCLRGADADLCAWATPKLNYQQKYREGLATATRACTLNSRHCNNDIYDLAKKVGPEEKAQAILFFKNLCDKNAKFCEDYSYVLENENRIPEALVAAKKFYTLDKSGNFPYLAYKHGNKKEGFQTAIESCRKDVIRCDFYLRYMPDHPDQAEIAGKVKKSCIETTNSSGATSCAIGGTFFLEKANRETAFDLWISDCDKNMTSCQLIIAEFKNDSDRIRETLSKMCEPLKFTINGNDIAFQKHYCADGPPKKVSAELQTECDRTLKWYKDQQE